MFWHLLINTASMDLKKKLLLLVLVALTRAEPEADPEAQAESMPDAEPQAQNLYGTGPIAPAPQIYDKPNYYPGGPSVISGNYPGGPSVISGKPDYGGGQPFGPAVGPGGLPPGGQPDFGVGPIYEGGQPNFGYPPIYNNPDPGFGRPPPGKPDYGGGQPFGPAVGPGGQLPGGKPDYNPGGNTCQMTDQCCGMDKENCCMGNEGKPKQSYTVWERQCEPNTELECPVTVQRKCYPIRVPECRTVTDIKRRTFQAKKCVPKPLRKCFDIEVEECNMGTRIESEEVSWTNQQLKKVETKTDKKCYNVQAKDCTNRTISETQRYPIQKQRTINETRQQCQMVQKRQPDRTVTVTVTRPQYKQMCYDMPVPKCSQTPCQSRGSCSSGTSACSLQQTNTVNICPQATGGQSKPPYATGGCQQVQQPACNMGPGSSTCGNNYQQCCKTESRKVCKTVMIRVPQQVQQTVPGGVTWAQECRPYTFTRVVPYTEWETKTVDRVKYDCRPVTKQECHDLEQDRYETVTVQEKGTVEVQLPTCTPQTKTINKCFNLPEGKVECINTPVEKLIKVTSQVCDGEKYIQKCFKIGVARCYESSVPNCRMVPRQVSVPSCSQSNYCNSCNSFIQNPEYGGCPNSNCDRFYGGGEEYRPMGNTTLIGESDVGRSIPSSGGPFYPYGQQTGFLVEDVDQPDVLN